MIRNLFTRILLIGVLVAASFPSMAAATEMMEAYGTTMSYEDARDNLQLAITGRGLVVRSVSQVGEMLERTGEDLGDTRKIYGKAEVFEFCSAVFSRKMMEADERNIAFCPFTIALYTLPAEPDKVYVSFRRPAVLASPSSADALREVEDLLRGIARQALELD
ncbi:DUF302 domain-containing protein [Endothiovibrio diazotrophicus]